MRPCIRAEVVRRRALCGGLHPHPHPHPHPQIEQVGEDDTLAEYLDGMFGPDAPPLPWDAAGAYTRAALEVYYQVRTRMHVQMTWTHACCVLRASLRAAAAHARACVSFLVCTRRRRIW